MKLMIFGANGQVGRALRSAEWPVGVEFVALDLPETDLSIAGVARTAIENARPDFVINSAAYTAVDLAESEPELANQLNACAPGEMAQACADLSIPILHYSTDYVFDGKHSSPYREDDPVNPVSVYGITKEAGECEIRQANAQHIILRSQWIYDAASKNFLNTMLQLGRDRDEISVVDDQYGSPTSAEMVASATARIVTKIMKSQSVDWGTYHFCAAGEATWYDFACAIFELAQPMLGKRVNVASIQTSDYPTPASRPAYSVMNCDKIRDRFGIAQPAWKDGLAKVMNDVMKKEVQ